MDIIFASGPSEQEPINLTKRDPLLVYHSQVRHMHDSQYHIMGVQFLVGPFVLPNELFTPHKPIFNINSH
jgi:hypothetical protein